jgi:hypothetical protein
VGFLRSGSKIQSRLSRTRHLFPFDAIYPLTEGHFYKSLFVVPAKAGIQLKQGTGFRVKPGMTNL